MIGGINDANVRLTLGNLCLAKAGVKANVANAATTTAVAATLKGMFINVPIAATISTAKVWNAAQMMAYATKNPGKLDPGKVAAPVNPGCNRVYVIAAQQDGACKVFEGDGVTATTNSRRTPDIHPETVGIGVVLIEVGTGVGAVPFQLGTTALATNAGTKLTVTFADTLTPWDSY